MPVLIAVALVLILSDIVELKKQKSRRVIAVYCTLFAIVLSGAVMTMYN
ncbi:MAG: hypothetical protein LBC86_02385 [Oscillospiraceae bacterium]|jgi:uncharacterized membrane protein|nr:hypothetical protein [Oscillospiraceae bacterium]